jgi:hypothetical protein
MSDSSKKPAGSEDEQDGEPSSGPSLTLLYSLIGLAMAVAIGLALLIVLPFYYRR